MSFTTEQIAALSAPLDRSVVKEREQGGRKVSYVEGYHVENEANRIFGFDAWDRQTLELRQVAERERKIGKGQYEKNGWGVSYVAKVRVTIRVGETVVIREGIGAGHGIDADLGAAHESAAKEAETDAEKRALKTFGNPFGQALYDKTQSNVVDMDAGRKSAAQAKRDGDNETIREELAQCADLEALGVWAATRLPHWLKTCPRAWEDPIHDHYAFRRDEILEQQVKGAA